LAGNESINAVFYNAPNDAPTGYRLIPTPPAQRDFVRVFLEDPNINGRSFIRQLVLLNLEIEVQ
jgi:hypothetical protein